MPTLHGNPAENPKIRNSALASPTGRVNDSQSWCESDKSISSAFACLTKHKALCYFNSEEDPDIVTRFAEEDMMKTLVTGGTGFLGSHLVETLLAQGHEVRALARTTSDTSHLETTGAELVYGDIEDYDSLPPAVKGVETVFHAAGRVTPGWGKWQEFESSIVKGTENVLKASAEAGVSRFLYLSSHSVYGKLSCSDTPVDESAPCEVAFTRDTYYDYAKLKAEELVFDYHNQGRIKVTVIRPAMIHGIRDRMNTDRIYRHLARRIIVWPGKSNPRCAPVYASDVAELAVLAANSDKAIGQVYNVAPPGEIWFQEYCDAMIRAQGGRRLKVTMPYSLAYIFCALMEGWARLRRAKKAPYLTRSSIRFANEGQFVDGSKARMELGWEPKVSMEEGCRLYVQWWRSQEGK